MFIYKADNNNAYVIKWPILNPSKFKLLTVKSYGKKSAETLINPLSIFYSKVLILFLFKGYLSSLYVN